MKNRSTEKNWQLISVDKIKEADWNYKDTDEYIDSKLEENIKRNGVVQNVIVRELPKSMFEMVNGNHRLPIIKKLGLKNVMAYNLGKISLPEAKRIAYETNETNYATDQFKLSSLLKDISGEFTFDDLVGTSPFKPEYLQVLVESATFDINTYKLHEENDPLKLQDKKTDSDMVKPPPAEEVPWYQGVDPKSEGFKKFRQQMDRMNRLAISVNPGVEVEGVLLAVAEVMSMMSDSEVKKMLRKMA